MVLNYSLNGSLKLFDHIALCNSVLINFRRPFVAQMGPSLKMFVMYLIQELWHIFRPSGALVPKCWKSDWWCWNLVVWIWFKHLNAGLMSWSSDSQYICTRNDNMPTVLWIWDVNHLELAAILIQKDPIRAATWDPTCTRLVLCTGSSHLYMWTPSGAYCVSVPLPDFTVTDLRWNSDGSCLLVKDKESFCFAVVPTFQESSDYSSSDD